MGENLSKINEIIGSIELSPSEVGTVLWLTEQDSKRVDDLCRIMGALKYYKAETFKKYIAVHKDKYESDVYYFDTLDEANEFASQKWESANNESEHHVYVGFATDVLRNENGEYRRTSLDLIFPIGAFDSSEVGLFRTTANYQIFEAI